MNRLAMAAAICLLPAAGAASVTVSLTPAEEPDGAMFPYAKAALALTNSGPSGVEAVVLRPSGGGPAVRYALAVPPGQEARREVALPAVWAVQRYRVEALGAGGVAVGEGQAGIDWPAGSVATAAFIDDAYLPWRDLSVGWPVRTRRGAALLLCLFVAAAGGALLVRRGWVRAVLVAVLAGGATALVAVGAGWPAGVDVEAHVLVRYGDGEDEVESFTVLSARRSGWVTLTTEGIPWPVYPDKSAAVADRSVVDPAARTLKVFVAAGRSRVIRPVRRGFRPAPGTGGTVREGADGERIVAARMDHRRALLVTGERCWPVPAGYGDLALTVGAADSRGIWSVLSDPPRWRLDGRLVRMLSYWRQRHQRPEEVYLLQFSETPGEVRMEVLRLGRG
ncbi:MAG TPA: hypothetical protein VFJ30_06135 [Phycisphaerae bacterium]|nr:hypothetical protein [Phycisphaerae bacterium]